MTAPDLSLDVIYVVACHLAGMQAFGTLANLHLVNHHVAETVLPVLYETVIVHRRTALPVEDEMHLGSPDRFRYTKFVITRNLASDCVLPVDRRIFPSLTAVLCITQGLGYSAADGIKIFLCKPVTAATLFGVIAVTAMRINPIDPATLLLTIKCPSARSIKASQVCRPGTGPWHKVLSVNVNKSAFLLPETETTSSWTTPVRLFDTKITLGPDEGCNDGDLDTVFELLKLAGRHRNPEWRYLLDEGSGAMSSHGEKYHLRRLSMSKEGYDAFAERFAREVALNPTILMNRIKIAICAKIPVDELRVLVDDLVLIYARHITSYNQLLPGDGPPYKLFTLQSKTISPDQQYDWVRMPFVEISVLLEGTDGNLMWYSSDVAVEGNYWHDHDDSMTPREHGFAQMGVH